MFCYTLGCSPSNNHCKDLYHFVARGFPLRRKRPARSRSASANPPGSCQLLKSCMLFCSLKTAWSMDCGSKQGNDSVLVKRNLMGRVWISRTTTEQVEIVSVWRNRPRSLLIGSIKIPWTTHCWGHWQGRQCHKGHSTRQRCSRRCRGLGDLAAWPSPVHLLDLWCPMLHEVRQSW